MHSTAVCVNTMSFSCWLFKAGRLDTLAVREFKTTHVSVKAYCGCGCTEQWPCLMLSKFTQLCPKVKCYESSRSCLGVVRGRGCWEEFPHSAVFAGLIDFGHARWGQGWLEHSIQFYHRLTAGITLCTAHNACM